MAKRQGDKMNTIEKIVYCLECVCTCGTVWLIRIIITYAIEKAIEKE